MDILPLKVLSVFNFLVFIIQTVVVAADEDNDDDDDYTQK